MSRERELLEQALEYLPTLSVTYKEISDFLSTPEPEMNQEPVAWLSPTSRTFSTVETSHHTAPLFLHPVPRPEFVRLSEEEIMDLCRGKCVEFRWPSTAIETARAIEDALEEKNK